MDSRIEELLDKYWKCETSLEEERELKSFFNEHEVGGELKQTSLLFKYFEDQKKQTVNEARFDKRVKAKTNQEKRGKVITMMFTSAKIAAGVVVLITAGYLVREEVRKSYPEEVVDTYSDPQLAFEETKKALMMISKTFGKAKEEAGKIKVFNEAEQLIQSGITKEDSTEKVDI
jgi:hypothetical protein